MSRRYIYSVYNYLLQSNIKLPLLDLSKDREKCREIKLDCHILKDYKNEIINIIHKNEKVYINYEKTSYYVDKKKIISLYIRMMFTKFLFHFLICHFLFLV